VSQQAQAIARDLFIEPTRRPAVYVKRAGVAGWYPLKGIVYFLQNREFWPLFTSRVVPLTVISIIVYFVLFTFTFLPQFAFLAIFHGWGAWPNAVVLVLGEGYVVIQVRRAPLGLSLCMGTVVNGPRRACLRASLSTSAVLMSST